MLRLIVLFMTGVLAFAAGPTTRLTVQVTNENGKPIDRASVIVKFVRGHSVAKFGKAIKESWELKTNQEGLAKIPPIHQGTILVQVTAQNYQTFGDTFDVDQDEKTIEVKLKPPQAQYTAH